LVERNRRLPDYKRVGGYVIWDRDFPRTASMKIKRDELACQIGQAVDGPTSEVAT
jgi:long-chain acyl-CoA synthetase